MQSVSINTSCEFEFHSGEVYSIQHYVIRRVWRYHRGNQNPYNNWEQTKQWPKEKVQKDKQRSTKPTYKTKDWVTRTPLKPGVGGGVNIVTQPVISREWWKDREVFTTSETYPWLFVTQIFHNGQPSHGGDHKTFEVIPST